MGKIIKWTDFRLKQAKNITDVIEDLWEYLPLTLRQIYYRLVAAARFENTKSKYNDLSKVIKQMRLDEMISWDALEDRTRRVSSKRGFTDAEEYLKYKVEGLNYSGFSRCMVQGQEKYIEIWVEKDALSRVFEEVAWDHCIRCVTCKGYMSISFLNKYRERANKAIEKGQEPVILYFGDFDASGVQMYEAAQENLIHNFGVAGIRFERVALNLADIHNYNLPNDPEAVKKTDSRCKAFVDKYGTYAVELDALHPRELKAMAVRAVEVELDMELVQEQKRLEIDDKEKVDFFNLQMKSYATNLLQDISKYGLPNL